MADKEALAASKVLEEDYQKKAADDGLNICGVIVFSTKDDVYEFVPGEGFPGCPPLMEMCQTDIQKADLTVKEREEPFNLITPQDDIGSDAKIFLRVEEGTEDEKIDGIKYYLNQKLGTDTGFMEKRRRHTQMLWSHRDILLKDYKYQVRSNANPEWMWQRQHVLGDNIKHRSDVIVGGGMQRIRPRRPESVTSTASHTSGMSRASSFAVDNPTTIPERDEPATTDKPESEMDIAAKLLSAVSTLSGSSKEPVIITSDPDFAMRTIPGTPQSETAAGGTEASKEAPDQAETSEASTVKKATPSKITVSDDEIKAHLEDVEVDRTINKKLEAYYMQLPKSLDDVPKPEEDEPGLRKMALKLRPYLNLYLEDVNRRRQPTISQTKPLTSNSAKREYATIKRAIEDRDKFEAKIEEKRWAIAKKKALDFKRSEHRKAAKEKAQEERKRKQDEAKAKKAEEDARAKEAEAAAQAEVEAQQQAGDEAPVLDPGEPVLIQQEEESSSEEEVVTQRKTASRSGPAPSSSTLPKKPPRAKRPYLPDTNVESRFGVILEETRSIWTELNSIRKDFERVEKNLDKNMGNMVKALEALVEDTNEIKLKLLRKNYHDLLKEADLERAITKYLPFDRIEPAVPFLLGNETSQKAITHHIWRGIDTGKHRVVTLDVIVNTAAKIVFSNDLRAFLKVESDRQSDRTTDEAVRGWDRKACPEEFYDLLDRYVMAKYDDIPVKESKSPLKRNRARSWKHILIDNFRNSRTTYFDHLAANFDNMDDVLNHRHEIKKAMYRQNHDEGERNETVPSNRQEKLWFVEQTPAVSHIDDLKNTPVQRKRLVYDNIRGEEIVNEDVQAAVNNLSAFYAGLPEFAGNTFDLVEGGLPTATEVTEAFEEQLKRAQGVHDFAALGIGADASSKKSQAETRSSVAPSETSGQRTPTQASIASREGSRSATASPSKRGHSKSPKTPSKKSKSGGEGKRK